MGSWKFGFMVPGREKPLLILNLREAENEERRKTEQLWKRIQKQIEVRKK